MVTIAKRAETKHCPVCDELIPIRLLAAHSELEMERVEDIIKGLGSTEIMLDEFEEGCVGLPKISTEAKR